MPLSKFNLVQHFLGLFAVIGNWPDWESYFDLRRSGLQTSFVALAAALLPLYLIAYTVGQERAVLLDIPFIPPAWIPFLAISTIFLLSFPMIALIITMVFDRQDRFRPWVITRHWTVFFLSLFTALAFGLTLLTPLPFMVANGIAFAAYFGLLAIDIRLAQKVLGLGWGAAILVGCVVIATGLVLLQLGLQEVST